MTEALARIVEKHSGYHWCAEVSGVEWKALGGPPCNVVKLARVLESAVNRGHRPECMTKMVGKHTLDFCDCGYAEALETLKEVASVRV